MEQFIRGERKTIDAIIIAVDGIGIDRELALVKTTLQRSQMFLGLVLGSIAGIAAAYPKGNDVTSNEIDARADQADFVIVFPTHNKILGIDKEDQPDTEATTIQKIKFLRDYIQNECINALETEWEMVAQNYDDSKEGEEIQERMDSGSLDVAIVALKEAKMWLGQELNTIQKFDLSYEEQMKGYKNHLEEQAILAYDRYGSVTDYKNFQGNPMPDFFDLPDKIKDAWKLVIKPFFIEPSNPNWYRFNNNSNSANSASLNSANYSN